MSTTVLICDDNIAIHEGLRVYLEESGVQVLSAYDGKSALETLQKEPVHLLILDLMLPDMQGLDVLRELRKSSEIPVIILSAKSSEFDRILGLELGADDYVVKPFSPREVAARVRAILRRVEPKSNRQLLTFGNLVLDQNAFIASVNEKKLPLTAKELKILALFAANPEKALTREEIMNVVWGYEYCNDTRAVDTHIMRLRQKLPEESDFEIASVYGIGYKLTKL